MTNAELLEFNSKRKIFQIGFLVSDLEKSMKNWVEMFNVGPWTVMEFNDQNCSNVIEKGQPSTEPFKFVIALAMFGDIQLELMQPIYGIAIYDEYIKKCGDNMHHIKEYIPTEKIDGVVEEYEKKGLKVTRKGQFETDIHIYMDTLEEFGFQLELGNCPDIEVPDDMFYIYPREE